jgi:hypothetical protein
MLRSKTFDYCIAVAEEADAGPGAGPGFSALEEAAAAAGDPAVAQAAAAMGAVRL